MSGEGIREQLAKVQADQKKIAQALKKIDEEIEAEWNVKVVPEGEEIAGEKF